MSSPPPSPPPTVPSAPAPTSTDSVAAESPQEQTSAPAAPTPAEPASASAAVASDRTAGSSNAAVAGQQEPAAADSASPTPSAAEPASKPTELGDASAAAAPSTDSPAPATTAAGSKPAVPGATDSTPASESTAVPPPAVLSPTPTPAASSSLAGTVAAAASAPSPSSLAAPASATPSRDASPSSAASSARLAATKKFSALNVNKKFLETAIATAGKENKDVDKMAAAKGAAAAAPAPAPTPHPPSRLLTTRPMAPPSAAPRPTAAPPSQWGSTRPAQGPGAAGPGARRLSGGAPWASGGARDGADGPSWRSLQVNFPTTKESLEDRERAAQKAAANAAEASKAEAEHQKAIIQELDSFRGSHLDPNAHHWDEPESDDDDFLNEVVDFGDGKKYTISASPQEPSFAADILDQRERLMAAENAKHGSASGGRGDYDRSRPVPSASKPQLFNERSNRLEPKDAAGGLPKGRRMSNDPAPARPASTAAPQPAKPAWGIVRDANGKIIPSLPPSRALPPHLAAAAALAAAGIKPTATPAAPAAADPTPAAAAARSSAAPSLRSGGLGSVRPSGGLGEKRSSLSAPRGALVEPRGALAKPTTSPRPAAAQTVAPLAADRRASHDGPRPMAPTVPKAAAPAAAAPAAAPAVAVPPPVIEDITELQKDEMHTAAERARLRRQKEEEERAAAQERARQKAKELEAKFGPATSKSAALQAKSAPKEIAKKPAKTGPATAAGGSAPPTGPRAGISIKGAANAPPLAKIQVPGVPVPAPSAPQQQQQQQQSLAPPLQPSPPAPASGPASVQPTLAAAPPTLAQLLEGQEAGAESQDVDFANLGDLLAAESSPTPAAVQPAASANSRRPAASDFFESAPSSSPSGPILPPPAPSRSESAWRRPSAGEKQQTPAADSASASPVPAKTSAPGSPELQKSKQPQHSAAVEDVMQRIKGVMVPSGVPATVAVQAQAAPAQAESPFTYQPRPSSPSPVWKKFAVKLNEDGRQRSPIPAKQLKVDPKRETLRAFDALSWQPTMYKWLSLSTLSRDEWLFTPPFRKVLGRVAPKSAPTVSLPTQRISDLPINPPPESPVFQRAVVKLPPAPALEVIPPTPARGAAAAAASQFSRSAQETTWRRAPQVSLNDPSAAVGGPIKPLVDAGTPSNALFATPQGPETTGAPIIRLRTPPGGKSSSAPKLPQGSSIGFYRDRTPSIGTASDEQMASLVRFTVSSELMDGPGGGDPVYEEDGPSFPSLNRPSSNAGSASVISAQDEAFEVNARATAAASALSPPSAATSDAWSKTPMAYSPADRPALPGLYGAPPGVPSHSPWAAAPSYDVNAQYSPKLSHHSPQYQQVGQQQQHLQQQQQQQQQQHLGNNGLRGQYNPYAQPQQQQQRFASPAHGYALPTSSPHPSTVGGASYSGGSTMNGNAPRFQPSNQQQQHSSTRPDPSARPFIPGGAHHHPGLNRNGSSDMGGSGPYGGGPGSSPIGGSPYSPGINLPGLPPAVQGGVWVPISMPRDGSYGSSPSLAPAALPTPYYTPQPYQQQQRSALGQQQQQPRFRNLSEFSTSSPAFTPQQQQRGAFGGGGGGSGAGGSPFEVRPHAAAKAAAQSAAAAGQDDQPPAASSPSAYFPSVRAPVFTPSGSGAGNFGKGGPW